MRLFLWTFLVISCTSNTILKKPDDLIEKEEMTALLTDLYLASAANRSKNLENKKYTDYTQLVFKKYGIDSARFKRSNHYYTSKIDLYEAIHKEVKTRITAKNDALKSLKKKRDSLHLERLKETRKKKEAPQP